MQILASSTWEIEVPAFWGRGVCVCVCILFSFQLQQKYNTYIESLLLKYLQNNVTD